MYLELHRNGLHYRLIYQLSTALRAHPERLQREQSLTLDPHSRAGLSGRHGLFGSEAWWHNVDSGVIATETVEALIRECYPVPARATGDEQGGQGAGGANEAVSAVQSGVVDRAETSESGNTHTRAHVDAAANTSDQGEPVAEQGLLLETPAGEQFAYTVRLARESDRVLLKPGQRLLIHYAYDERKFPIVEGRPTLQRIALEVAVQV